MDPALIAQVQHGPGMHGGVLGILLLGAIVIGLMVYFAKVRRRSETDSAAERNAKGAHEE